MIFSHSTRPVQYLFILLLLSSYGCSNGAHSDNLSCPPTLTISNSSSNSSSYQIHLSSHESYSPDNYIEIKLQFTEACLNDYQQDVNKGPSWYMIEAIYEDTGLPAMGEFKIPINFADAFLKEKSIIIFESNHPSLIDLQGKYRWTPSYHSLCEEEHRRPVCFRATVRHHESTSCEMAPLVCIPPSNDSYYTLDCSTNNRQDSSIIAPTPSPTHSSTVYSTLSSSSSHSVRPSPLPIFPSTTTFSSPDVFKECMKQWPCTESKLKDFCGSNGVTYSSRCHWRRALCLLGLKKSAIPITKGPCPSTTTVVPPSSTTSLATLSSSINTPSPTPIINTRCLTYRRLWPGWKPECMRNGKAKPIQCDRIGNGLWCWCSFSDVSEVSGSRRLISNCGDENKMDCLVFF